MPYSQWEMMKTKQEQLHLHTTCTKIVVNPCFGAHLCQHAMVDSCTWRGISWSWSHTALTSIMIVTVKSRPVNIESLITLLSILKALMLISIFKIQFFFLLPNKQSSGFAADMMGHYWFTHSPCTKGHGGSSVLIIPSCKVIISLETIATCSRAIQMCNAHFLQAIITMISVPSS